MITKESNIVKRQWRKERFISGMDDREMNDPLAANLKTKKTLLILEDILNTLSSIKL
jgi:hypothetical protein